MGRNFSSRVQIDPTPALADAFGRLRVGEPLTLFDSTLQYDERPDLYYTKVAGAGTVTHLPDQSSALLSVAGAGDSVIRQSRSYLRYQPGKSLLVLMTFLMGTPAANVTRLVGYGDDLNGIFLKEENGDISLVLRSNVTGVVTETEVPQASWNMDPLDGTGVTGRTVDIAKVQILVIDLEWLGVGRVRVGFNIEGRTMYVHAFDHANFVTSTYITSANLPVRYEISSTGAAGDMKQICAQVASEGGFNENRGRPFGYDRSGAGKSISTTLVPVLSLRPKVLINGIVNRATIIPQSIALFVTGNAVLWKLIYNPATLTGATWTVDRGGSAEADVAATAFTGGTVIQSGYVPSGGQNTQNATGSTPTQLLTRLPLTLDIDGLNPTNLVLACQGLGGNATVYAALNALEYF